MFRRSALGIVAASGLLVLVSLAESPNVRPDATFKGSSLTGWHVLGEAEWTAHDGELTGKAKSGSKGGWLVLDQSYQDVGFYADLRCSGDCVTGVLLRAEKTADGMKGVYAALTGDTGVYAVTLDAQGQELTHEKLRPTGGTIRFAPAPGTPAPAAGGRGRGAPALRSDDWTSLQIILDSDILRVSLNKSDFAGVTEDNRAGYGPIALYV